MSGPARRHGFGMDVLAAYRRQGKGRGERQVTIVREHVPAGRSLLPLADLR